MTVDIWENWLLKGIIIMANDSRGFPGAVCVLSRCLNLCDPMDQSLPASCIHGILQVRLQKWVAIPLPGGIPGPGIKPKSSAGGFLMVMSHQGSLMTV